MMRPFALGPAIRAPRLMCLGSADGIPALLHHGFLISDNDLWTRTGVVEHLVAAGRRVVLIEEHFLRDVDEAHALGHDCTLLLAESLATAADTIAATSIDVIVYGEGVAPGLVLGLNDARVRRLVVADPFQNHADLVVDVQHTGGCDGPTIAEYALGVDCTHGSVQALPASDHLRLELTSLAVPTLVVSNTANSRRAAALANVIPRSRLYHYEDDSPVFLDPRLAPELELFLRH